MNSVKKNTEDINDSVEPVRKRVTFLNNLVIAILVVLFIGFAGMFVAVGQMMVDSLLDKRDSTYDLQQKIDTQNSKIDFLTDELKRLRNPL